MWVEIIYASSGHDFKGKQLGLHCRCGCAIDHGDEYNLVDGGAARKKDLESLIISRDRGTTLPKPYINPGFYMFSR